MKMKIRPLQDRILVRRLEEDEMTKGALSYLIQPRKSRPKVWLLPWERARSQKTARRYLLM